MQSFPFKKVLEWYKNQGRQELPWRQYFHLGEKDVGYHVWLSEIILQQTQVERCIAYYNNILKRYPTVESLAHTTYEEFFPYYKGLGYYSRARNMLKAAKYITEIYSGIFPQETEQLLKIPGVGPYTAQAIRAFAYDIPTLSFDTNLEKIFSRFYYGSKYIKISQDEKKKILRDFVETQISSRQMNAALMDFASIIDINTKKNIDWDNYTLHESKFFQTRGEIETEKQKKQSSFPSKEALVISILHENHKIYFSNKKTFFPFLVGKNTGNPRKMIQKYFGEKYGLEVSVRPPELKSYLPDETPYIVCYTQIQSGKNPFKGFEGIQVRGNEESLVENIEHIG